MRTATSIPSSMRSRQCRDDGCHVATPKLHGRGDTQDAADRRVGGAERLWRFHVTWGWRRRALAATVVVHGVLTRHASNRRLVPFKVVKT
jgi:hypothetical protein